MNKQVLQKKIYLWDILCVAGLFIADRLLKYFLHTYQKETPYVLIDDVLSLSYVKNYGGTFGILNNQKFFFIFISTLFICLIIFLICVLPRQKKFKSLHIWLSFLLAGLTGNMTDRIIYGYVLDYFCFTELSVPVFNLADIFISVGTLMTIIVVMFKLTEKDFEFLNFKQNKYREIK